MTQLRWRDASPLQNPLYIGNRRRFGKLALIEFYLITLLERGEQVYTVDRAEVEIMVECCAAAGGAPSQVGDCGLDSAAGNVAIA